jgi:hypothetical protein
LTGHCDTQLRGWEAYKDLKRRIEDLQVKLPLFASLAKPSIRERHWEMIREKTGTDVSPADPEFSLGQVRQWGCCRVHCI